MTAGHPGRSLGGLPSRPLGRDRIDLVLLGVLALVAFVTRAVPILFRGGLEGLHGYDDGVYFAAAIAFVNGTLPYRDFLLLHPPGIVLALSPFAWIGGVVGDPAGFAAARVAMMALGAFNAVLVALVAGRYGRVAGFVAGGIYAVWSTASIPERSTDLHVIQNTMLLVALLVVGRSGRIAPGRAAVVGAAVGLAVAIQLWQGLAIAVLLWWVIGRARGQGLARIRPAAAFVVGAAISFAAVVLPFLVTAQVAMVRLVLLDQLGRPSMGVGIVERLRDLVGVAGLGSSSTFVGIVDAAVVVGATIGLVVVLATGWRFLWTRPWVALVLAGGSLIMITPSFFPDYPNLIAAPASLVLGTAAAAGFGAAVRRGLRPDAAGAVVVLGMVALASISIARQGGQRLPIAELEAEIRSARCVSADSATLLVLTSAMRRDVIAGCPVVVDPTGVSYDVASGPHVSQSLTSWRRRLAGYQQAMASWYGGADAAMFVRMPSDGLSDATTTEIERRLPVERHHGPTTVRLPAVLTP
jgi:alpha-1,2-mannosyltransferase